MKHKIGSKAIAVALALCLSMGSMEFSVSASTIGNKEYKPLPYNGKISSEGIVLQSGYYEVTENTVLKGKEGQSAIKIEGDVTIYIAKEARLTCTGGNGVTGKKAGGSVYAWKDIYGAEGGGGGGAGIELPVGSQLTIIGQGEVIANGGNGGAGGAAADGSLGTHNSSENTIHGGAGGSGAGGGGGAGAGIGTIGAVGGAGGSAVIPENRPMEKNDYLEYDPVSGNPGKNSEPGEYYCGNLVVKDDIRVIANGGRGGFGGTSSNRSTDVYKVSRRIGYPLYFISGGGGNGGPGGSGAHGQAFGHGGAAGGGGGAGNTGGMRHCATQREQDFHAGGRGGEAGMNADQTPLKARGKDADISDKYVKKAEEQPKCEGGKVTEHKKANVDLNAVCKAYFTSTTVDVSSIKTDIMSSTMNTLVSFDVNGKIYKRIYAFSKEGISVPEAKEGFVFQGWKDENGKLITNKAGELVGEENTVWRIWDGDKLVPEYKRIKDPVYIDQGLNELGEITLDKAEKIKELRETYDALTPEEKEQVKEYQKLLDAERQLKNQKDAAAKQMIEDIKNIGVVELIKEDKINEIRKTYDSLYEDIKNMIPDEVKNILLAAERELNRQKEQQATADQIVEYIKGIGAVDLSKEEKISEIRKKYDQLSEEIKKRIPDEVKNILIKAEETVGIQKQGAANQITEEIKGIGKVDLTKEEKISEIRKKYDQLPEGIKNKISEEVKNILFQAEQQVIEIKKQESKKLVPDWKAGVRKVKISWNKIPGVKGYYIYGYDRKKKKNVRIASLPSTASSYTVSRIGKEKLADGTTYQITVRPHRIVDGKRVYEKVVKVNVMTAPKRVVFTSVKRQGSTKAKLTWKKVKGVSGYQVLVKSNKQPRYKVVKTLKKNKGTIKGLSKKQKYTFKVRAIRKYGGKIIAGPVSKVKKLK